MKQTKAQPRIGETWITRSGISVGIINTFDETIRGIDGRKVVHRFFLDGSYLGPTFMHNMDLMNRV